MPFASRAFDLPPALRLARAGDARRSFHAPPLPPSCRAPSFGAERPPRPTIFPLFSLQGGDVTGLYLSDEEGILSTVDVTARFINGKVRR